MVHQMPLFVLLWFRMATMSGFKDALNRFEAAIVSRGEKLFANGKITIVSSMNGLVNAEAEGSNGERYDLWLRYEEGTNRVFKMSCTCHYAKGHAFCKHMAALLYALDEMNQGGVSVCAPQTFESLTKEINAISMAMPTTEIVRLGERTMLFATKLDAAKRETLCSMYIERLFLGNASILSNKELEIAGAMMKMLYDDEKERVTFLRNVLEEVSASDHGLLSPLFMSLYRYSGTRQLAAKAAMAMCENEDVAETFFKSASPYNEPVVDEREFMVFALSLEKPLFAPHELTKKTLVLALGAHDAYLLTSIALYLIRHRAAFALPKFIIDQLDETFLERIVDALMNEKTFDFVTFLWCYARLMKMTPKKESMKKIDFLLHPALLLFAPDIKQREKEAAIMSLTDEEAAELYRVYPHDETLKRCLYERLEEKNKNRKKIAKGTSFDEYAYLLAVVSPQAFAAFSEEKGPLPLSGAYMQNVFKAIAISQVSSDKFHLYPSEARK